MKTTLKRGVGRSAKHNGNGHAVFPPGPISTITRYRQPPPPERSGIAMLGRILLGTFLAVLSLGLAAAGGSYLWFHESVAEIAAPNTPDIIAVRHGLQVKKPDEAAVALVVGYDHRAGDDPADSRSDTLMLVRADPKTESISMLSFPRDLLVDVYCPGSTSTVYAQINSAYSRCGPQGTLKTVQKLTGIPVNYMVLVNFRGFREIVDKVDGIWLDIDRRYFNRNDGRASTSFSNIDLQPGYQRLGGAAALSFVRFRHTDDDYHRNARQQQFVRAFKEQVGQHFNVLDLPGIVRSITKNVDVVDAGDFDEGTVLQYARLAATLPGGHLFQVKIEGVTGYAELTMPPGSLQTAVSQFVNPDVAVSKAANNAALGKKPQKTKTPKPQDTTITVLNGNGVEGSAATANSLLAERGYITLLPPGNAEANAPTTTFSSTIYFNPTRKGAKEAAIALERLVEPADVKPLPKDPALRALVDRDAMLLFVTGQTFHNRIGTTPVVETPKQEPPNIRKDMTTGRDLVDDFRGQTGFPLMVPTVLESGSTPDTIYGDTPARLYKINGDHKAVRLVFKLGNGNEYWGVQETDWDDAPALSDRSFHQKIKGRDYDLYYSGKHLHMVVLRANDASYWVVNTLLDKLSNETMWAIAKGLKPLAAAK